jgi:hypothetical protein
MQAIYAHTRPELPRFKPLCVPAGMMRAIYFLMDVIERLPPIVINLAASVRPTILVWSDAMYARKSNPPARGGFIILIPAEGGERARVLWSTHAAGFNNVSVRTLENRGRGARAST